MLEGRSASTLDSSFKGYSANLRKFIVCLGVPLYYLKACFAKVSMDFRVIESFTGSYSFHRAYY